MSKLVFYAIIFEIYVYRMKKFYNTGQKTKEKAKISLSLSLSKPNIVMDDYSQGNLRFFINISM